MEDKFIVTNPIFNNSEIINYLIQTKVQDLARTSELGKYSFDEIIPDLIIFQDMLIELVNLVKDNNIRNSYLISALENYISRFSGLAKSLKDYNFPEDAKGNFSQRNNTIGRIRDYMNEIYNGNNNNNFLSLYSFLKNVNLQQLENKKTEIDAYGKALSEKIEQSDKILNELRFKASEKTVYDYALIFKNEATKHSSFNITFKPFKLLGAAERWLSLGIILLCFFAQFLNIAYEKLPVINDNIINYPYLILKVSIIFIFIFVISFSFKQYSINKHLFTLNKQRENALSSYKLFIETIDKDDTQIRDALMLEVAKSIYEQGKTGYLHEKGKDIESPSILEITRLMSQK